VDQIKVLIIDPDAANSNFLAQLLHKKNYQVLYSGTGKEGIENAVKNTPNLIIFDTNLPDLRAAELVQQIQQNPLIAGTPCVVLSSHSNPDEMQALLQAGCLEYYVKSGMVMVTLVEAIPKLLLEAQRIHPKSREGLLIVFLSAKGGIGTSSLCANIGMNIPMQIAKTSVAVVDMVLPFGSIASLVGYDGNVNLISVSELPAEQITPDYFRQNLVIPPRWQFSLLAGSPDPDTANRLHVDNILHIVETLRKTYDYVLIDLGRSLSKISLPIIHKADLIAMILSTDLSTASLTKKLWQYLQAQSIEPQGTFPILNRAVGTEGLTKAEAEKLIGLEIKLTMPYLMGNFTLANNQNMPISLKFPTDTASMVLKQAAIEISQQAIRRHEHKDV
jgi:pilus assembly protein CpaE